MATDRPALVVVQPPPGLVGALQEAGGWPVERCDDLGRLLARLDSALLVVLGPEVGDPVGAVQQLRRAAQHLPVLVLADGKRRDEVVGALRVAPFIGRATRCLPGVGDDGAAWVRAVVEEADAEERRRVHAAVVERLRDRPEVAPLQALTGQYLGQLVEHAPIGVVTIDERGLVRGWNPKAAELFGRRPRDTVGTPFASLFPDAERARLLDAPARAAATAAGVALVCPRTSPSGTPQHLELVFASIDVELPSLGSLVLVSDVTDRVESRRLLAARAREAELVAEVGLALTATGSLEDGVARSVAAVVHRLAASSAELWLCQPDGSLALAVVAGEEVSPRGSRLLPGEGLVGRAALTGRVQLGHEGAVEPAAAGAEPAVAHPLAVAQEVIGVLATYAGHDLDDATVRALGPVADALAVAVRRDRAEGQVRDLLARELAARQRAEVAAERHANLARTLQRSLLPPGLPEVPGFDVAADYHWAGDGSIIGGDFYDVFPLGDGRWCAAIGDVTGKGAEAASLTALARYTLRAAALTARSTAELLATLNHALLTSDTQRRFCTVALVAVAPTSDGAEVEVNLAGHPPPLRLTATAVAPVPAPHNPPVGVFEEVAYRPAPVRLAPGDALVLHTDGVTEARRPDGSFAEDVALRCLAGRHGRPAGELVAALVREVVDVQDGWPRDDLAIIALRRRP